MKTSDFCVKQKLAKPLRNNCMQQAECKFKERLRDVVWMHGGPWFVCLHGNLIYMDFSVSEMKAVLLTQATEEQNKTLKKQYYWIKVKATLSRFRGF